MEGIANEQALTLHTDSTRCLGVPMVISRSWGVRVEFVLLVWLSVNFDIVVSLTTLPM